MAPFPSQRSHSHSHSPFHLPAPLPPEILTSILTKHLTTQPACVLALFCPDWHLCRRPHPAFEAVLRTTRVDTYYLPAASASASDDQPQQRCGAAVATSFDHLPADHEALCCLPVMRDPRRGVGAEAADAAGGGSGAGGTGGGGGDGGGAGHGGGGGDDEVLGSRFLHRELVRAWTDRNVFVLGQKASRVGPLSDPIYGEAFKVMVLLREMGEDGDVGRVVPFEDDYVDAVGRVFGMDGREKAALPSLEQAGRPQYVFQRLRHLVVNTVPALAKLEAPDFGTAPSAWDAAAVLNMIYIDERLDYERRANLLLRWGAMERLESLCLDLRGYSLPNTKYLFDEDIVRLASSLSEKGLSLLVIAGLRSYRYYGNPDPLTIEEVERGSWDARRKAWVDEERGRRINWWKMFKGAVRPGGRLVFVDKDGDDGNGWRPLRPVDRPRAMQGS